MKKKSKYETINMTIEGKYQVVAEILNVSKDEYAPEPLKICVEGRFLNITLELDKFLVETRSKFPPVWGTNYGLMRLSVHEGFPQDDCRYCTFESEGWTGPVPTKIN